MPDLSHSASTPDPSIHQALAESNNPWRSPAQYLEALRAANAHEDARADR